MELIFYENKLLKLNKIMSDKCFNTLGNASTGGCQQKQDLFFTNTIKILKLMYTSSRLCRLPY